MIAIALQVVALVAAGIILARSESALNRMSRCTPILIRGSFFLLAVGAAYLILSILAGDRPSGGAVILTAGVAMLLICERRLRVFLPPRRGRRLVSKHPGGA
jgi:hypothetical protein